jgi:hypothetical protein
MADTQEAPQPAIQPIPALGGSITEAQEALLSLMEPEEDKPKDEEAAPTEKEESTEETHDESLEEESEEELEASAEEESEESDEGVEEEPELYALTVDGTEVEVTFDELLKGYSRQSDYTKKTQEVAEQRKEFDAMKQNMAQEYQQIQTERNQYVQALQSMMEGSMGNLDKFANVDWEALKGRDPIEYVTRREEFREAQEKVQGIQREQQMAQQRQAMQSQEEHKEIMQKEHTALVEALPDWGNPEKQKDLSNGIRAYAMEQGFQKEELDSLIDHRSILVLLKAKKYDQLQKTDVRSKKLKNKPRVVRAGSGVVKESKSKRAAQMKRLRGTGHINDASALLEDFIDI